MNPLKILIVSRTPWNNSNSFGNTFTNLFGGMKGVEIYNVCCQGGVPDNDIVVRTWQMTDKNVLKSFFSTTHVGQEVNSNAGMSVSEAPDASYKFTRKRRTIFYLAREAFWKIGRWKNRGLDEFVKSIAPDLLYLPIYKSGYMCDVQEYIIKLAGCPVVGHITDDVYSYTAPFFKEPLNHLYTSRLRHKIRRLISRCAYLEVFAKKMVDEYSATFGKSVFLIGKGISAEALKPNTYWKPDGVTTFVFTGNYGGERGSQLLTLAEQIKASYEPGKAVLDIYSPSSPDIELDKRLEATGCVRLRGGLKFDALTKVQREADVLVHVEGFSTSSIAQTRLSFSTKLIDYMVAQRPILAIGPSCINSIEVLRDNHLALVASSGSEVKDCIDELQSVDFNPLSLISRTTDYLKAERLITHIQREIYGRLSSL